MRNTKITFCVLTLLFTVFASVPFLVPHTGWMMLFAFVPLLVMDALSDELKLRGFFWWHYLCFVLWNAVTTFWVCNATVGGGIFAVLANAAQMSLVWTIFRLSKKRFSGILPYVFLMLMWIAWERAYFSAQISWPWLTLGNAFAGSTRLVQWYEFTGTLGGSLWAWLSNLWIFLILCTVSSGSFKARRPVSRVFSVAGLVLLLAAPVIVSVILYDRRQEAPGESVAVVIAQPNFDPYEKFVAISREKQNVILLDLFDQGLRKVAEDEGERVLLIAPETFTSDVIVGKYDASPTWSRFLSYLQGHPETGILFGASCADLLPEGAKSYTARSFSDGQRYQSRNSAILMDSSEHTEIYHKSRLVVGTEFTPYPAILTKIDDMLGGVMGRCVGQDHASVLHFGDVPLGSVICYESVFGEYCTEYIKAGARALVVITNDAWWGDTPGYRQHLNYSRLRAIETRRDIARCANTGISAFIDSRGEIISSSHWWEREVLTGRIALRDSQTFFVRYGDITGRICTFAFLLLLLALCVRLFVRK